jgi:hypothetical protein
VLTVAGLIGRPRIGSSASPTLRFDSLSTKQARIMRSTCSTCRAYARSTAIGAKRRGARHQEFDLAPLDQQMPPIRAVTSVGLVEFGHAVEMLVDRLLHLPSQDLGQRPLRTSAIQEYLLSPS